MIYFRCNARTGFIIIIIYLFIFLFLHFKLTGCFIIWLSVLYINYSSNLILLVYVNLLFKADTNETKNVETQKEKYRVSIKSFPDYKHLVQENYVKYKHIFPVLITNLMHDSFIL
jgi:hypothetical protein